MALFPSMGTSEMKELVDGQLEALSENLLKIFNIDKAMDFSNLYSYLAYSLQYISIASGIYGAILGASALKKEESQGTISFLYAKPITRRKILNAKIISHLAIYFLYILIIGIVTFLICFLVKKSDNNARQIFSKVTLIFFGFLLTGVTFFAISLLMITFLKKAIESIPFSLALFFVTYFIGVMAKIKKEISWLKYFSPADYFSANEIINTGIQEKFILISWLIVIFSFLATYFIYGKKDLS